MRSLVPLVLGSLALTFVLLPGCSSRSPVRSDGQSTCRYAVEVDVSHPAFQPNVYSSAGGGLVGAGYGTACAVASLQRPNADADFDRFLRKADADALPRALAIALNAPRAECSHVGPDVAIDANPDVVVEIVNMESGMGCLFGQQEYWITVQWRTTHARSGKVSIPANTRCTQSSYRSVDDWFANPDAARMEIERVLAKTGQRIAKEILVQDFLGACRFRSHASGEVEAR